MGEKTDIGWTDHTFNPWWGCTKVSQGCKHCYAETVAARWAGDKLPVWGPDAGRRRFGEHHWEEPILWNARARRDGVRRRVFCGSMCDWLEDRDDLLAELVRLLDVIRITPGLDWLLLSKRPELFHRRLQQARGFLAGSADPGLAAWLTRWVKGTPPVNVWGGVSIEDQPNADRRIPELLALPFVLRFLSVEPLLSYIRLPMITDCGEDIEDDAERAAWGLPETIIGDCLDTLGPRRIDWVIIGCENLSGRAGRPAEGAWVSSLVRQCRSAGVPVFVKQLERGGRVVRSLPLFPAPLQIQEFPNLDSEASALAQAEPDLFGEQS